MNFGQAFVLVVLTIVVVGANAGVKTKPAIKSPGLCRDLVAELKAMRAAQNALLTNMVANNQTMATTLEDYSLHLKEASKIKRPISIGDISSLHRSASAFRAHGARESKLVMKFNRASESLVSRIETCIN